MCNAQKGFYWAYNNKCEIILYVGVGFCTHFPSKLNNTQQNKLLYFTAVSKDMATSYLIPFLYQGRKLCCIETKKKQYRTTYDIVNYMNIFCSILFHFKSNVLKNHIFQTQNPSVVVNLLINILLHMFE